MPRITVATLPDKTLAYDPEPYRDIPMASTLQYPEITEDILKGLLSAKPEEVEGILRRVCNV